MPQGRLFSLSSFVVTMSDRNSYNNTTLTRSDDDPLKKEACAGTQLEDIDLVAYYEEAAGRLVVDPQYVF